MEHMLKRRLEWFVESKNILAKTQYGFRKGLSTTDSIAILTTDIRIALSNNQFLVGVFLDISAAYDNVLLPVLRQKLLNLSIPVRLAYFVCNLLMERSIQVRVQGSLLEPRRVWRGLPQGSVLSPLLYSLYTYDLELCVNSFCNVLQYADDLVLYVSSDSLEEATTKLNQALLYLEDWLSDHGLSLSVGKSSAVVFTRKRSFPDVDISFAGEQIPVCQGVKFLGIYLDKTMSGKDHLNYIVDKCEKNINILRSLSGVWWGSHPYSQKLVYNAIVRSIFDYGSLVLEPCNKTALRTLDKVQYQCLRIILGAMKSSPTNALQVEALDPPLDTRRSYLADRYFSKVIQYNNHPLLPKLELLSSIIPRNNYWFHKEHPCLIKSLQKFKALEYKCFQTNINPLFLTSFDSLLFKPNIMLSFGILKDSPGANAIFDDKINSAYNDWLHLYTDASKADDGRVGAAVWAPKYSTLLSFKCPPICTVFTGEAVALLEAVKFIRAHNFQKTIIFSDSLSCLYAIDSNQFTSISKSPLILQVREILYDCHINNIEVVIAWIPSHTGIRGNEVVDSFAREAITSGCADHYQFYALDLACMAKVDLNKAWQKSWDRSKQVKGRYYGDIQPEIPSKPWFFRYRSADKQTTSVICRLRIGHACTPLNLFKLKIRNSPMCDCGTEEGSTDHIFFNCPLQPISLYDILPSKIPRPINMKSLLLFTNTPFIRLFCKYIHRCDIKL
ncbi:uncharacterized protein LOC126368372 isoform X2 [Pectinophora gossypiella]|uniref:uncharacterized protein LOC126368372 isoform X2 n=1 Tax=Pectinophora gossypiella TaxID=13191 RepID=UPI00214E2356|nr:uncharacterized protein LOC126368372 isoform X2 [Pectinophora gossypiella]